MPCCMKSGALPTYRFVGGETMELEIDMHSNEMWRPFDLTSCTANLAVINWVNRDGAPLVTKEMTVDTSASVLRATLLPSDTVALAGKYLYQVSIRNSSGKMRSSQGVIYISRNIDPDFVSG